MISSSTNFWLRHDHPYRVSRVTGDRYAGEFPRELFRKHGIAYDLAKQTKSELFRDLLPLLNSGRIVLPRNDRLQGQIVGLERRTSAVGRDTISHPDRGHDDVANAVAGAAALSKFGGYDTSMAGCRATTTTAAPPGSASVFKPSLTAGRVDDRRKGVMGDWGDPIIQALHSSSRSRRHRLAQCVLRLEPHLRWPGAVRHIRPLRDDAFQPHAADVLKHGRAVTRQMLSEQWSAGAMRVSCSRSRLLPDAVSPKGLSRHFTVLNRKTPEFIKAKTDCDFSDG